MIDRQRTVLVVDDMPDNLAVLLRTLGAAGYEVLAAENAREALEIVEETTPDIFLLDVMMPEMDGFALCRRLKEDTRTADIPVLFITARTTTQDVLQGFEAGGVDYITKPVNPAELLARVRTHVRLHEALVELDRLRELALDANPLTQLPGNNTIAKRIQEAIKRGDARTVIYCDLDNFKAYNDRYGFSAGDQLIQFTATVLRNALDTVCRSEGFLGHIGGDDFVLIVQSDQAQALGEEIVKKFDGGIGAFYEGEAKERNGIVITDRQGRKHRFPLVSLSMAGVHVAPNKWDHCLEVASACAEAKKMAKAIPGSNLFLDRRQGTTGGYTYR
ncbi:MAG: response regulator [Desulfomonilaceae bacterium]|nr:response regulator [Desulfomonilaceae bacterium]